MYQVAKIMVTKVYFPKIRLTQMLARPGGLTRDEAMSAAISNVREISGEGDREIENSIVAIEKIATTAGPTISKEHLTRILEEADQIVTLAGIFNYAWLNVATRKLCDIADGLLQAGLNDIAPILVHVRAIRFFAPSSTTLDDAQAKLVLSELEKVHTHYKFRAIDAG